jgi:hypothetical protein
VDAYKINYRRGEYFDQSLVSNLAQPTFLGIMYTAAHRVMLVLDSQQDLLWHTINDNGLFIIE